MEAQSLNEDEGIYQRGLALYSVIRRCSVAELQHLMPGLSTMRAGYIRLLAEQTLEEHEAAKFRAELVRPKTIGGPYMPGDFDTDGGL